MSARQQNASQRPRLGAHLRIGLLSSSECPDAFGPGLSECPLGGRYCLIGRPPGTRPTGSGD
jgi:hypothetical protein